MAQNTRFTVQAPTNHSTMRRQRLFFQHTKANLLYFLLLFLLTHKCSPAHSTDQPPPLSPPPPGPSKLVGWFKKLTAKMTPPPPPPACPLSAVAVDWNVLNAALSTPKINQTTCKPRGVIGQHIATNVVASAITEHYSAPPDDPPQKPLVLMLFGAPGVGKSYLETTLRKVSFSVTYQKASLTHRSFCLSRCLLVTLLCSARRCVRAWRACVRAFAHSPHSIRACRSWFGDYSSQFFW